jgi:hypothetical protein
VQFIHPKSKKKKIPSERKQYTTIAPAQEVTFTVCCISDEVMRSTSFDLYLVDRIGH